MAGEEVRIVAVFDDSDVQNGVARTEQAAREMKRVWETTTWVGAPVGGGGGSGGAGGGMFGGGAGNWETVGASAGDGFMKGFLGKLLLRDAVYGIIRGFGEMFSTAMDDLSRAAGAGPFRGLWKTLGDGYAFGLDKLTGGAIGRNAASEAGLEYSRFQMQRTLDEKVSHAREDPSSLKETTSSLQDQLDDIIQQRDHGAKDYYTHVGIARQNFDASGEATLTSSFQIQDKYLSSMESFLKELVSIGKERDKKNNEDAKEQARKDDAENNKRIDEQGKESEKQREDAAKKAREDEAIARNRAQHALTAKEQADEAAVRPAESDIRNTEEILKHQRATSAVRIGGGLFGRNDSAAALVTQAQQQVSLLRGIREELIQIRKDKGELTLK